MSDPLTNTTASNLEDAIRELTIELKDSPRVRPGTEADVGSTSAGARRRRSSSRKRENQEMQEIAEGAVEDLRKIRGVDEMYALGDAISGLVDPEALDFMNELQRQFGGLAGEGGKNFLNDMETISDKYAKTYLNFNRMLEGQMDTSVDGLNVSLKNLLGSTDQAFASFVRMAEGADSGANGLKLFKLTATETANMAMEMAVFGQGMELNTQQTATFIKRQISLTGEAGTDMLQKAAVAAKRVAAITGDSSKEIMDSIEGIIADTQRYGNVNETEAAEISASLRQLGLDYKELGGMTDKFFNFDSAVSSVSALTSVFGVQIDAMEAMRLANSPDRLEFLHYMRDQFMATGKSVEDMTLAEKRLIQQQMGLSSVGAVERLLDPTADIKSIEELNAATAEGAGSVEENMKLLEDDLRRFGRTSEETFENLADATYDALVVDSQETLLKGTAQYQEFFTGLEVMAQKGAGMSRDILGIDDATETLSEVQDTIGDIETKIIDGIIRGLEQIGPELVKQLKEASALLRREEPTKTESPSQLGRLITEGIVGPQGAFSKIPGKFKEALVDASGETDEFFNETVMKGDNAVTRLSKEWGKLGLEESDFSSEKFAKLAEEYEMTTDRFRKVITANRDSTKVGIRNEAQNIEAQLEAIRAAGGSEDWQREQIESLARVSNLSGRDSEVWQRAALANQEGIQDATFRMLQRRGDKDKSERSGDDAIAEGSGGRSRANERASRVKELEGERRRMQEQINSLKELTDKIAKTLTEERDLTINLPPIKLEIDNKTIATAALDGVEAGAITSGGKSFTAVLKKV